jgi:7-cyano-7-deazaguanine reductase
MIASRPSRKPDIAARRSSRLRARRAQPIHLNPMPKKALSQRLAPAVPPTAPSRELQVFPNPSPARDYVIRFDVPEFTCVCPLTGQPDFAHFTIEIVADKLCVELKSLKMYFWSYRNEGAFHEKVTNAICDDLVAAIAPRFLRIHADWYVRGGIRTFVTAEHRKKGWKPAPKVELPAA